MKFVIFKERLVNMKRPKIKFINSYSYYQMSIFNSHIVEMFGFHLSKVFFNQKERK
jgi:hypothetical protein